MLRRLLGGWALLLAAGLAQAGEAGQVIFVAGTATADARPLALNAPIHEGELLSTAADGYVYIKTPDNGLFVLRPNTKARIAVYQIDRAHPANTRVKLELLSGVARSKSGEAVKLARQNFRFNTPVAAIGVRGTDFVVFTNEHTSSVSVLSGKIVMSGFAGACRPEGTGPCEGAASRELTASQKGQLLQIQRGQAAAQLIQAGGAQSPDTVAPPRSDEPLAKATTPAPDITLDPLKQVNLSEHSQARPDPSTGGGNTGGTSQPGGGTTTPPPIIVVVPPPEVDPIPVPIPTPVPVPEPTPTPTPTPTLPVRTIVWGRFAALANQPVQVDVAAQQAAKAQLISLKGYYALFRADGAPYTAPERGSIGFALKDSEAYLISDNVTVKPVRAQVENGALNFNFDTRKFSTSFDLVNGAERIPMAATGSVVADGRFSVDNRYAPGTTMYVDGVLSNEQGGSAAYLFQGRVVGDRTANGVTVWGH